MLRPLRSRYRTSSVYRLRHSVENRALIERASKPLKLHLGCGPVVLDGWLNIDAFKYPGVAVMQLPSGLGRFTDNSVAFIYCSHVVEHIDYPHGVLTLLREAKRILSPGGAIRIVVPGIERIIRAYVADDHEFFLEQEKFHPPSCTTKMEHLMYALQQDGEHKYGYDFETARKVLMHAGFNRITDSAYNESEFDELRIDYRGNNLSLFVEAVK